MTGAVTVSAEQGVTFVAALGATQNCRLRSWTFTLDGHDFYVLRLGEDYTLVYDFTTESWSKWQSSDVPYLHQHVGLNWYSMNKPSLATNAVTNVVCGDDSSSYLYTLNPYVGYDEDTSLNQLNFTREVLGGVPMRTRRTQPVGGLYVVVDSGNPQVPGATISLATSDDYGKTWQDHGSITPTVGDFTQEFSWRSLGLIRAPGKAFKITDNGAAVRIESMEIR